MRTIQNTLVPLVLACAFLSACSVKPKATDTGYVGTWVRGGENARSVISIVAEGEGYLFRWGIWSRDGKWTVRCNWDGVCEEFVDGEKTSDYQFRTWVDSDTDHLMVECTGKVMKPKVLEIHYIDELVLDPDGKTLWSYTLERMGHEFKGDARPQRTFEKMADAVANPPVRAPEQQP